MSPIAWSPTAKKGSSMPYRSKNAGNCNVDTGEKVVRVSRTYFEIGVTISLIC